MRFSSKCFYSSLVDPLISINSELPFFDRYLRGPFCFLTLKNLLVLGMKSIVDFTGKKCFSANLARIVKLFNFLPKGKAYHPTYYLDNLHNIEPNCLRSTFSGGSNEDNIEL